MIKIRLARHGSKKRPFYKIVIADSRFPKNGRFIEKVGFFNPIKNKKTNELQFNINIPRIQYWKKKGAQLSRKVNSLLKKNKNN